jgi:cysteine desulfurase
MTDFIYLDHGATTPLDPRVLAAMLPWLRESYANPSSLYGPAREAHAAVEEARAEVAVLLGARPSEIVFTSGGSESINTALRGIGFAQQLAHSGSRVITTSVEHQAVLHTCQYLEKFGFGVTYAGAGSDARVDPDEIAAAVGPETALVSVMLANNEVGTIEPLQEIARLVHARGARLGKRIPVHTDAVAAAGQLPLNVLELGVDALSLAAHKFGGPKGAGILFLRRGVPFLAQQTGGGQEHQRRAGTENVAAIVGTAVALRLATTALPVAVARLEALRDRLIAGVLGGVEGARLNGHPMLRLPGNASFRVAGVDGERLLHELDREGIAASSGSACADASWEPSHVVLAMGFTLEEAAGSIRFTLGPQNTPEEIERVIAVLPGVVERLRGGTPALPCSA